PYFTIAYYSAASALMYFIITGIDTGQGWLNLAVRIPLGMTVIAVAMIVRESEIRAYAWRFIRSVSTKTP
ncbi:MAG TPA: hypothetical protein VK678_26075, partial [Bradyrhizobium sp.]|nr:hypothetical protein [Bradyrhizobium sp.]